MYCCCPPQTGRKTLRTSVWRQRRVPPAQGHHHCNFLTHNRTPTAWSWFLVFGEKPFLTRAQMHMHRDKHRNAVLELTGLPAQLCH